MIRKIIEINKEKCNGCGACASACHEGAISMVNEKAVQKNMKKKGQASAQNTVQHTGCTGSRMQRFDRTDSNASTQPAVNHIASQLGQWPCQIKLVPVNAPYFDGAKLLIAANCTAFAYANLHQEFMRGKVTLIGCPKLDDIDYSEKLTQIIQSNNIQSITVIRMEIPCCGVLEAAAKTALQNSGKFIPWQVVTISVNGNILE